MNIFVWGLIVLSGIYAILFAYSFKALPVVTDDSFRVFQRSYLVVYLLAAAGDWLQVPYIYALYQSYGIKTRDIEILYVAGFGSSMLFGTVVGSEADKYGRKASCILYGILYGLAGITKHVNDFTILMIGQVLGGIATSILYSAFESWVIQEHHRRGFDSQLIGTLFSRAVVGNSIVAIVSGLIAQRVATWFSFVCAPFDMSLVCLVVMGIFITATWGENYGDQTSSRVQSFGQAITSIRKDYKILCLGLIQSLFEGSMYTFVLDWSLTLVPEDVYIGRAIPHGFVFAGLMVSIMIGSTLFDLMRQTIPIESFMRPVLLLSSIAFLIPIIFPENQIIIFTGLLMFEVSVGIFWPSMSTLRDKYVPEATRATIMNIFRVPLNLIVIIILTQNLEVRTVFALCVTFLFAAFVCQVFLFRLSNQKSAVPSSLLDVDAVSTDKEERFREEKIENEEVKDII